MLLSIIVPVYNVGEYLEECLESLVKQELNDFEVICVNDGSTDNSLDILNKYKIKYPNLLKVYTKNNGGLADTRNYGISKANGEYVGFVDSDDWVSHDMFKKILSGMISNGSEIGICDYEEIYESNRLYISDVAEYKLLYESLVCNKVFKKSLFIDNEILFPIGLWYEDNAVTYKLLYLANKIYKLNEAKYFYRRTRDGSIMNSQKSEKIYDMWKIADILHEFFDKQELSSEECLQVEYIFFRNTMFRQIPKIVKLENPNIMQTQKMIKKNFEKLETRYPKWKENSIMIEDSNSYYYEKIGKNHMKSLSKIKRCYLNMIFILLKKKVNR